MSLEFEKAKLETITYFAQEMSRFNFQNGAEGSALRTFIAVADSACPAHFAETGELRASLSGRSLAKASGMFRGRTSIAADRLEAFDVLRIESTGKANRKFYKIRPANVWLNWRDTPKNGLVGEATRKQKNGLADLAIFENQNGPTHEATLDPKTASSARPLSLNKTTDGSSSAFKNEPSSDVDTGSFTDAAHRAAANGGEAPANGASPAYEPDADAIVLNEDSGGPNNVTQPQNSAGSATRPTGFRADLFVGMKPEQAQDAAEEYFAESFSPEFQAELFVQDLVGGFNGGDRYGRDGVARALSAELCGLSTREAARRLDVALTVAEALLSGIGCATPDLRSDLAELAQSILSELTRDEVKHVGRA